MIVTFLCAGLWSFFNQLMKRKPPICSHESASGILDWRGKLWTPVRQNLHFLIWLLRIVCQEMYPEIMRSIHTSMHHKNRRFDGGAFARSESHRTDGKAGGSAALQDFHVRGLAKPQRLIAYVCHFDIKGQVRVPFFIAVIDQFLFNLNGRPSLYFD